MIINLAIAMLFLSIFCSLALNQQTIGFLLAFLASHYIEHSSIFLLCLGFAIFIQFANIFFLRKKNMLFWLVIILVSGYIFTVFAIKPYKVNILHFIACFEMLLLFAWAMLIKWDAKEILKFAMAVTAYLLLFGFTEWLLIRPLRIEGPLTAATAYAIVLVLAWTIWFIENCVSNRFSWAIILAGTSLVLIAVLLSGTRMAIIGMGLGVLFGAVANIWVKGLDKKYFLQRVFSGLPKLCFILAIIFCVWALLPEELLIKRGLNSFISGKLDSSSMGRIAVWIVALNIISEHTMWGIGPGNFLETYKLSSQHSPVLADFLHNGLIHAHNIYLVVLSEYGLIGFLILSSIVLVCFAQLFIFLKKNPGNGIGYALLGSGAVMMLLGIVDAIPMYLPTMGWGAWYMGVLASFSLTRENKVLQI